MEFVMEPEKQMENERNGFEAPGPHTKGGGLRGGPKRWTGKGPPPARHIPWPEIFKHHISLVEGHIKMMDMVRKHTVEGTGNFKTVSVMLERGRTMLSDSKHMSRNFVPPPKQRDQVPLGSSSVSMYPGYSPADFEYGKAANEYGNAHATAKREGIELPKEMDMEYEVGQSRGIKRYQTLAQMRAAKGEGSPSKHTSNGQQESTATSPITDMDPKVVEETDRPSNNEPIFFVDTKPTPVDLSQLNIGGSTKSPDNAAQGVIEDGPKRKKSKKKHSGELPLPPAETVDITHEVQARIEEKEAKQKKKREKKRKRESGESDKAMNGATHSSPGGSAEISVEVEKVDTDASKPKKKKKAKHDSSEAKSDDSGATKKRRGEKESAMQDTEGKKRKKRKKDAGP